MSDASRLEPDGHMGDGGYAGGLSPDPERPQLVISKNRWGRGVHEYRYDGKLYPGVTGVLGVLKNWAIVNAAAKEVAWAAVKSRRQIYAIAEGAPDASDEAKTLAEEAAVEVLKGAHWKAWNAKRDHGINVHAMIASGTPSSDVEAPYVAQYNRWVKEYEAEVIAQEVEVVNPESGYGGKVDLDARVNGAVTTVDLKVRDDLRTFPDRLLQVAAYALAPIGHPEPVERAAVLTLGPNDFSYVEVENLGEALKAFEGLIAYRNWLGDDA